MRRPEESYTTSPAVAHAGLWKRGLLTSSKGRGGAGKRAPPVSGTRAPVHRGPGPPRRSTTGPREPTVRIGPSRSGGQGRRGWGTARHKAGLVEPWRGGSAVSGDGDRRAARERRHAWAAAAHEIDAARQGGSGRPRRAGRRRTARWSPAAATGAAARTGDRGGRQGGRGGAHQGRGDEGRGKAGSSASALLGMKAERRPGGVPRAGTGGRRLEGPGEDGGEVRRGREGSQRHESLVGGENGRRMLTGAAKRAAAAALLGVVGSGTKRRLEVVKTVERGGARGDGVSAAGRGNGADAGVRWDAAML
uniref:Methyl-CpG binding protein-like n=1 Tax=Oryza sativa subsp. japonica TaxID=39947 RepID=Q5VNE7_ORYSJ|nr:methyl-CpG binding protein-like [Oryza sativa Japonica Group]